jgi:hypothetical protein
MGRRQTFQCKHVRADGTRCRANTIAGSEFCFFHDPAKAREREDAQRAGGSMGKAKVLPPDTQDVPLASTTDAVRFLGQTINQVRRGEIDPRVANTIGYLSATLLRALEQGDIERRLAELEAIIKSQPPPGHDFDLHDDTEDPAPAAWEEEVA